MSAWLPILHLVATAFMTGLIWFVQIVHYPLFANVGAERFRDYEDRHTRLTTLVVGPGMLIEAAAAAALLALALSDGERGILLPAIGAGLLVIAWGSTALIQVPCHRRLVEGYDERIARRLTRTNWLRTAAWSGRTVVAALLLPVTAGG